MAIERLEPHVSRGTRLTWLTPMHSMFSQGQDDMEDC